MSVGILEAYRVEFSKQAAKPVFIDQQTSGLSFGQYSQWFDMVPQTRPYIMAAYVLVNYTLSGSTITAQSNADNLDVWLGQVQVAPSARVMPRSQTITRRFMEDVEQITYDTNYGYPRPAVPTTAGTYTSYLYVPIGGQAAAVRFLLPSSTNAYSAGTVVINSITVYAIEGANDTVVSFKENNTPALGTSIQSIKGYLPDDIAPDVLIMVGDTTTDITQTFLVEQGGQIIVAATDSSAIGNGLLAVTPRTGSLGDTASPSVSTKTVDFGVALQGSVLSIAQMAFSTAEVHDLGVIQYAGSGTVPSTAPQTTPSPPAVAQTGTPNAAGVPVSSGSRAGRGFSIGAGSRFARK